MSFEQLGFVEPILRALKTEDYTTPTPIQAQAIPQIMLGRDLFGSAQTGTGKTAAFALPILHRLIHAGNPAKGRGQRIRVLVLSPTRELASQIGESFRRYGQHTPLKQTVIYGGVNQNSQVRDLRNGVDIVIATPGRLVDLIQQGWVDLSSVQTFVMDEADRMLDMGFLPDLKRVIEKLPTHRQTVFFSATVPHAIQKLANEILRDPVQVHLAPAKATTELIEQSVCFVPKQHKTRLLTYLLTNQPIKRAIVFTRTKHGADRVTDQLNRAGITAGAIHGNKTQAARQRTLSNFKGSQIRVLVATDVAARGIDVDGVTHVLNYDLPEEAETYVHRIGRTGRAGATGTAISFCDVDERRYLKTIERLLRQSIRIEKDWPVGLPVPDDMIVPNRVETNPRKQPSSQARDKDSKFGNRNGSKKRYGPKSAQSKQRSRGRFGNMSV